MIDIVMEWLGDYSSLNISDQFIFLAVVVFSYSILQFLLDFFRFLMYYISGGNHD